MPSLTRQQTFLKIDPLQPKYRWAQLQTGLFNAENNEWSDISTISATLKSELAERLPWISLQAKKIVSNRTKEVHKALLETSNKSVFESVLMKNSKDQWTLCLSSQIGCAMKCVFCATGTMGLQRSLNSDEIVDQFRFWQRYLANDPKQKDETRITNMVIMGMGEPLANYDNIKNALQTILEYTGIGQTKITVSSVGIIKDLNQILTDPDWPAVRIAISLHAPNQELREQIIPTTTPDYFPKLAEWAGAYLKKFGNRNHHLTFEYILLGDINDQDEHAKQLAKYANSIDNIKVNLIPYNSTNTSASKLSRSTNLENFKEILRDKGISVTTRKSLGHDLSAACGQLVVLNQ